MDRVLAPNADAQRDAIRKERLRTRRGALLFAIYLQHPHVMTRGTLEASMLAAFEFDELELDRDLHYLAAKDYLRIHDEVVNKRRMRTYQVLPLGIEVCDGLVADPNVIIARE